MQPHGWSLLPEHAYIDDGVSGARLDRPALDRLRDAARRGACDAVVRVVTRIEPEDTDRVTLARQYERYRKLYPALRTI